LTQVFLWLVLCVLHKHNKLKYSLQQYQKIKVKDEHQVEKLQRKKINFYQGNNKLGVFFEHFLCSQVPLWFFNEIRLL